MWKGPGGIELLNLLTLAGKGKILQAAGEREKLGKQLWGAPAKIIKTMLLP